MIEVNEASFFGASPEPPDFGLGAVAGESPSSIAMNLPPFRPRALRRPP